MKTKSGMVMGVHEGRTQGRGTACKMWRKMSLCLAAAAVLLCGVSAESAAAPRRGGNKTVAVKADAKQSALANEIMDAYSRGAIDGLVNRAAAQNQISADLVISMTRCLVNGIGRQRNSCLYALSLISEPKYAPLILTRAKNTLEFAKEPDFRMLAAKCIGKLEAKGAPAIPLLEAKLKDPVSPVRRECATALGKIKAKKQGPAVLELAKNEEEVLETRQAAILALAAMEYTAGVGELDRMLASSREAIRLTAAKSLCLMNQPSGKKFVTDTAASADEYKRKDVVWILGENQQKWAQDTLAGLLNDKSVSVQIEAAKTLARGKDLRGMVWLIKAAQTAKETDNYELINRLELAIEDAKISSDERKAILEGKDPTKSDKASGAKDKGKKGRK